MDFKIPVLSRISPGNALFNIIEPLLPVVIIIGAMFVAVYWVFLVPIFQSPDEDYHSDYVFTLYSKGGLIKGDAAPLAAISHPFIFYLFKETNGQVIKYTSYTTMPPDYGTKQFFRALDAGAPDWQACRQIGTNPVMMAVYPIGYYALVATLLSLISHLNNSLSFLFFSARLFSVALLGGALTLSYLTMRELKLSRWQSSLILATIAFFPLTPFVGSYIQPDNLSFTATGACFFLALRWRNRVIASSAHASHSEGQEFSVKNNWVIIALSLSLALLLLSKYHFFCCLAIAIAAMIVSIACHFRISSSRVTNLLSALFIPALVAAMLQLWISWDCDLPKNDRRYEHWFAVTKDFQAALHTGGNRLGKHIVDALQDQYASAYTIDGQTFVSFWGCFGQCLTVPLVIVSESISNALLVVIEITTNIVFLFSLGSLVKIAISLFRMVRKKRLEQAFYIACSNPVLNSYFLFVVMMFLFSIAVYHSFYGQGRHWLPLMLPIFLGAVFFAPRMFYSRLLRKLIFWILLLGWLGYSLLGSYFAPGCIKDRYYGQDKQSLIDISKLTPLDLGTSSSVLNLDFIEPYPTFDRHPFDSFDFLVIPAGRDAYIQTLGWAIDFLAGKPAKAVVGIIDGNKIYQAIYGIETKQAVKQWNNDKYMFCGYGLVIPTKGLKMGKHKLSIKVVSSDGRFLYNTHEDIGIIIK